MRVINPCVSHMPIACPPDWHASLVVSKGAVYVRRMSLIVLSVEFLFRSASFWGKPWRFRALIEFSASSVLFQMLPSAYWTYKSLSSFGLRKQLTVFPVLISGLFWKIGHVGHYSPYLSHAKRALYHLSYVPVEGTGSYCLINLSCVFEIVEQSPLLRIVVILALSMLVINPCVSHMPIACPPDWHASLVVSKGVVYVRRMSLILLSV